MESRPFQQYASAYDVLYKDKDYDAECRYIEQVISKHSKIPVTSILDLGCGTAGHLIPLLKRGYEGCGVDLSPEMLEQAKQKASQAGVALRLEAGDISSVSLGSKFDLVICMFAVLSYQITNQQLQGVFHVVREHLKPGGLFICDFWYGPEVLRDPPEAREKRVQEGDVEVRRKAAPRMDLQANTVEVNYDVEIYRAGRLESQAKESHQMRYFFIPELRMVSEQAGLQFSLVSECCELDHPIQEGSWTISAVFQG